MFFRVRCLAGFLFASFAASVAAGPPPEPTATQRPVFLTLAKPLAKSTGNPESGTMTEPSLIASPPPIGTQTVATRDADGRVQVRCHEVPLRDARVHPRRSEQQP